MVKPFWNPKPLISDHLGIVIDILVSECQIVLTLCSFRYHSIIVFNKNNFAHLTGANCARRTVPAWKESGTTPCPTRTCQRPGCPGADVWWTQIHELSLVLVGCILMGKRVRTFKKWYKNYVTIFLFKEKIEQYWAFSIHNTNLEISTRNVSEVLFLLIFTPPNAKFLLNDLFRKVQHLIKYPDMFYHPHLTLFRYPDLISSKHPF